MDFFDGKSAQLSAFYVRLMTGGLENTFILPTFEKEGNCIAFDQADRVRRPFGLPEIIVRNILGHDEVLGQFSSYGAVLSDLSCPSPCYPRV